MQSTLHKWFIGNTNNTKISHIFYLDWDDNSPGPKKNAVWLNNSNKKIIFKKEVNWRYFKMPVVISGNQTCTNKETYIKKNPLMPVIKSNLQKCVRRSLTENALSTALKMIQMDFIEFIRRIAIIMLEDCVLHESFSTIVWMTAAYPEWQPNKNHINWLLGVVKYLSDLDRRDLVGSMDFDFKEKRKEINALPEEQKSLIYSLYFRSSYGGMNCDIKMITHFSKVWLERLQSNSPLKVYLNEKIIPIMAQLYPIKPRDIELASIDFHCYSPMLFVLQRKYSETDLVDIKRCIWFHSSRVTNKVMIEGTDIYDNKYSDLWEQIRDDVLKLAYNYRRRLKNNFVPQGITLI